MGLYSSNSCAHVGEEEKEYWKKLREGQGQKRDFGGGGRGFNNNRGFDNRGRGRLLIFP